jgi:hypothetical protein
VSWWAPGIGIATVIWSGDSYTLAGGEATAVCFAIAI